MNFTSCTPIVKSKSIWKKRIIVIGAGFAGINAVKKLCHDPNLEITLIDRRNHHLFQPLLYQVATAGLSPADIATPILSIFSENENVTVIMANVDSVNLAGKTIRTSDGVTYNYDYLVMACGAKHSYFGHEEWEPFSPGLKTLEQATEIRRRILLAYELAEKETDSDKQKELLTFVVVGGGPTGVELAGTIGEISRQTLSEDFRNIRPERTRVLLIEAGPRLLPAFSEKLSKMAARDLEKLGVQIWTSTRVTNIMENRVELGSENIKARTIIWAAGVQPSSLGKSLGTPMDKIGRVIVEKDVSLQSYREVFVLGDQAMFPTLDGKGLPGLAPVAMQQGTHAAKNILADQRQKPRQDFKYNDKGVMATIGRKSAIVQMKHLEFGGLLAWITWLFVHIFYLIGFKNRVFVFMQWAWSYVTFKRGARLIVDKEWRTSVKFPKK
ncbi:MAG: NAD(P)/FAD-dependent oxidoreductase [Bdellovibrionota bacterium]